MCLLRPRCGKLEQDVDMSIREQSRKDVCTTLHNMRYSGGDGPATDAAPCSDPAANGNAANGTAAAAAAKKKKGKPHDYLHIFNNNNLTTTMRSLTVSENMIASDG